jgi:hypothetical protein
MLIKYGRSYTDYSASTEKWSSIISLAHMWHFETMSQAAFKAYIALPDVEPADKIAMRQKYDFPRKDILHIYQDICTRHKPLSFEEGEKIGLETLTIIAQTREEIKYRSSTSSKAIVTHNLISLHPCYYYR